MKNLILASTSTIYGSDYLEYILPTLKQHFANVKELLFVPYAQPNGISYNNYTTKVSSVFNALEIRVKGIHEFNNSIEAINNAEAIFIGGGNTFELLNQLYKNNLIDSLKYVINNGVPYLGISAGSNICGQTIGTTNDMPIVYPPSFKALQILPFNINPHYLDANINSKHMGETRETRIYEFHKFNTIPVIGLREGSWLEIKKDRIALKGVLTARVFKVGEKPFEINPDKFLSL